MKYTIGCDPELFLKHQNVFIASCGLVGGTKEEPLQIEGLPQGYTIQEDNVAVEFGIPPADSKEDFKEKISKVMEHLKSTFKNRGLDVSDLSAISFLDEQLWHPNASVFGCDPDYNIWTGRRNPAPKSNDPNLRSCGGHVHVGINPEFNWKSLLKNMDLFLGVPSILMDKGELRKQLYGKAGAFRKKPYGVEYRTLSNFWVHDINLVNWVWDSVEKSVQAVESQFPIEELEQSITEAINTNNKELALELVKDYGLLTVGELNV